MRNFIKIILIACLPGMPVLQAQQRADKVENLRVEYITRQVGLTEAEAEKFWPLYNEYHLKLRENRKLSRQLTQKNSKDLTEDDARSFLDNEARLRREEYDIYNRYSEWIRKVIGDKKYVLLRSAEESFRREMVQAIRERRQNHTKPTK